MPKYPKGLMDEPVASAVEALGGTLIDEAVTAHTRLEAGTDDEALHDFRVALRRLRSVMQAFRPYIDHRVDKRLRRRLRDLARATNSARDTEVQVLWVEARREALTPMERVGAKWFLERLIEKREQDYESSLQAIDRRFPKIERRVRKSLRAAAADREAGNGEHSNFALALEALIGEHTATLERRLAAVGGPGDQAAAHATRIRAKRLRYLMELVEREVRPAKSAIKCLKELQDLLGDLHDAQVVIEDFGAACEQAAAENARRLSELGKKGTRNDRERRRIRRRNATPGMLALVQVCRDVHDRLFQQFGTWRESRWSDLAEATALVLADLRTHTPLDLEVERKYLLTKLPDVADGAKSAEVDQGWLPGTRLVERVRRTKSDEGEKYYRTIKGGSGVTRIEIEEEASAEVFEQLWPLTEGRRVRKKRYYVPDEDLIWEIDEFLDRDLWLAEVELPSPTVSVTIPAWLEASLEREVTGEPEYVNVNLAR
jgi:CHAD domain-containing protein/CYTH domain-containing protein